jgi:hypothetical protein
MRISGKEADDFEARCRDGHRIGWFGSVELPGGGEEVVTKLGTWWHGDELERAATRP